MKTIADIRRDNLELLVRQFGTLDALADKADTSSVYLSQIRNRTIDIKTGRPREMGSAMAARLSVAGGKPKGWMDTDHGASGDLTPEEIELIRVYRLLGHTSQTKVSAFAEGLLAATGHDASPMPSRAEPAVASRKPKRAA